MSRNKFVNLVLIFILVISLTRYYNSQGLMLSKANLSITIFTLICAFGIFFFRKEKYDILKNNYLKPSLIYFLGYVLVYFFEYIAYVIGEYDNITGIEFVDPYIINEAAICSLCSMVMCLIGYNSVSEKKSGLNIVPCKAKIGNVVDFILFVLVVVFYFSTDPSYFKGGYSYIMNNGGVSFLSEISQKMIHACQLVYTIDKVYNICNKIPLKNYICSYSPLYYISMLSYLVLVLFSGDRGPIIYIGIIYIATFYIVNRIKLRLHTCVIGFVCAAVVISMLGTIRMLEGDFSFDKIAEAYEYRQMRFENESSLFVNTSELSRIVRVYHVLYDYADNFGLFYGFGLLDQILGIIPGLRYFLYPLIGYDNEVVSTSNIATALLHSDHGMGTTCIGDIYINIGFYGTIIFSLCVGVILRKVDVAIYNLNRISNIYMSFFSLAVLSFSIYIPRSVYSIPLNVSFYALLIYILASRIHIIISKH